MSSAARSMRLYSTCAQTGAAVRWRSSAIHSTGVTCQAGWLDSLNHPLLIAIYVPGMVHDRKAAEGALFGDLAVEVSVEPPGVEVDHKTRWIRQPNDFCTCATPGSMHTLEV